MGFRVTPEMKQRAKSEATLEGLRDFAKRIGCVVVGDGITCTVKQKKLITQWWKDHADDK